MQTSGSGSTEANAPQVVRTRPRPRPIPKKKPLIAVDPSSSGSGSPVHTATSSTKVSSPLKSGSPSAAKPSPVHAGPQDTSLGDDFSLDIAERAKLRSRARTAPGGSKGKQPALPEKDFGDVIELSSDEDELALRPAPTKRAKTAHAQAAADTSISGLSETTLPVATPDVIDLSTQLPPSSASVVPNPAPPPVFDNLSPLSSPLPLPSRKRKRPAPVAEVEEEDSGVGLSPDVIPAPNFLAASSSSILAPQSAGPSSPSKGTSENALPVKPVSKAKQKKAKKRVDGEDEGDDLAGDALENPKAKPRRKSRADEDDEEEWGGEAAPKSKSKSRKKGAADDDDESDWEAASKPKPKPKRKAAPKKAKKVASPQKVEVVINTTKGSSAKGKGKAPISEEVVADSEEERESGLMLPPSLPSSHASSGTRSDKQSELAAEDIGSSELPPDPKPLAAAKKSKKAKGKEPAADVDADFDRTSPAQASKGKKRVAFSDGEDDSEPAQGSPPKKARKDLPRKGRVSAPAALEMGDEDDDEATKENDQLASLVGASSSAMPPPPPPRSVSRLASTPRSYSIPKKSMPMSELIRKVNSQPGSPFASPRPTYSPYAKSSKRLLSNIAPLHPNRHTPPPALPRPPPPKKTKKQLEMEERWETELEESIDGWFCLPDEERAALRRAKRDRELGYED